MDLLRGAQNKVQHASAAVIAPIVTSAEYSYRATSLVDRSRVVGAQHEARPVRLT